MKSRAGRRRPPKISLKKMLSILIIQALGVGIVISFFMPWVKVDIDMTKPIGFVGRQVDRFAKTDLFSSVTDRLSQTAAGVVGTRKSVNLTGFEIARSGRNRTTELFGGLLSLFGQQNKDPRRVVYLFAIPVIGAILAWLSIVAVKKSIFLLRGVAITNLGIAVVMASKLLNLSFSTEFVKVDLMIGIWMTCLGFFLMALIGFARLV